MNLNQLVTGYSVVKRMLLHVPAQGGLGSRGIKYLGYDETSGLTKRQVRCGEAIRLDVNEGDLITLVPEETVSATQIFAFHADGANALKALGLNGEVAQQPLHFDSRDFDAWRRSQNIASDLKVYSVFDESTPEGERFTLRSKGTLSLWIALPTISDAEHLRGGTLSIEFAVNSPADVPLPTPLGDVREEFRLKTGTARAYHVQEGEYIQIIDIEGRQCSDFMALRRSALEDGLERYIDSTVTRSLVGGAYPQPGLFDKFYDQDQNALVQVVQDTVGRHDTFALACTARGYEDRGFPGHVNCSDNISDQFEPFGIKRRSAWPAINFFFNTWIAPNRLSIQSDEAWSRPGDYVVMRALTDLLCVSTACPDDIDPINGWNPTDIHVRIYKPTTPIRYAVAHRPFAESEPVMTNETAFHPRTSQLTRSFHVARDVWLPSSYEGSRAIEEYWACREAVTVQDMSSLRKYDITGPDAEKLLDHCMTRNVTKLSINRGFYSLMASESGTVIDDGTLFRLANDLFRWCCGSEESAKQLKAVAEAEGYKAWIRSHWSSMPNLAIQGPKSRELLSRLVYTKQTHPALENIKWFGFTIARLHDENGAPFMLTRSGFTGELGYEIFCDQKDALKIWDALFDAGQDLGIKPMGGDALEMLRIEAGLMVAGAEFGPDADAYEAGLGFAVDMKKENFIGKSALERNRQAERRKLVGLLFDGNEHPHHGDPILKGNLQVGTITSATLSPMLKRPIALARLEVEHGGMGTRIEVGRLDGRMKRLEAEITTIPFVDPQRTRARS